MLKTSFKNQLDRQGNVRDAVGKGWQETNRDSDIKEKVEVDRSHLKETG